MKTKSFDCVAMTREIRDKLSATLEAMTPEERIRYTREQAEGSEIYKKLFGEKNAVTPAADATPAE